MRLLWLCNLLPGAIRQAVTGTEGSGLWMDQTLAGLRREEDLELRLLCRGDKPAAGTAARNLSYYIFPEPTVYRYQQDLEQQFTDQLRAYQPDVIHIWGTEYGHTLAMLRVCHRLGLLDRTVVSIQGLCSVYARHYAEGIPASVYWSTTLRDLLRLDNIPGQPGGHLPGADGGKGARGMKSVYLHEVSSAFTGFSAYVFGAFLLLFGGIYTLAYNLDLHVAEFQYVLQNMSFLFIFIIPVVTMRVWAEERRQRTEQLLYALPLTMTQVVMGKYLALLTQLAVPVGLLGLYPLALSAYGNVPLGAAYSALGGFFFLGAALLAIGLLISCLTESQAAAAGLCFVVMLLNYFLVSLAELVPGTAAASLAAFGAVSLAMGGILYGMTKNGVFSAVVSMLLLAANLGVYAWKPSVYEGLFASVIRQMSLFSRFTVFVTGVFDWTAIVYDVTVIGAVLVFAIQILEKRRWSE